MQNRNIIGTRMSAYAKENIHETAKIYRQSEEGEIIEKNSGNHYKIEKLWLLIMKVQ